MNPHPCCYLVSSSRDFTNSIFRNISKKPNASSSASKFTKFTFPEILLVKWISSNDPTGPIGHIVNIAIILCDILLSYFDDPAGRNVIISDNTVIIIIAIIHRVSFWYASITRSFLGRGFD